MNMTLDRLCGMEVTPDICLCRFSLVCVQSSPCSWQCTRPMLTSPMAVVSNFSEGISWSEVWSPYRDPVSISSSFIFLCPGLGTLESFCFAVILFISCTWMLLTQPTNKEAWSSWRFSWTLYSVEACSTRRFICAGGVFSKRKTSLMINQTVDHIHAFVTSRLGLECMC